MASAARGRAAEEPDESDDGLDSPTMRAHHAELSPPNIDIDVLVNTGTDHQINPKKVGSLHRLEHTLSRIAPGTFAELLQIVIEELTEDDMIDDPHHFSSDFCPVLRFTRVAAHYKGVEVYTGREAEYSKRLAATPEDRPLVVVLRYKEKRAAAAGPERGQYLSHWAASHAGAARAAGPEPAPPPQQQQQQLALGYPELGYPPLHDGVKVLVFVKPGVIEETDEKTGTQMTKTREKGAGIRIEATMTAGGFTTLLEMKLWFQQLVEEHAANNVELYSGLKLHLLADAPLFSFSSVASRDAHRVRHNTDFTAKALPAGLGTEWSKRGFCLAVPESLHPTRKDSRVIDGVEHLTLASKEWTKTKAVTKANEMKLIEDEVRQA